MNSRSANAINQSHCGVQATDRVQRSRCHRDVLNIGPLKWLFDCDGFVIGPLIRRSPCQEGIPRIPPSLELLLWVRRTWEIGNIGNNKDRFDKLTVALIEEADIDPEQPFLNTS